MTADAKVMPLLPIVVLMLLIPLALTLGASFVAEFISGAVRELGEADHDRVTPAGPVVAA